MWEHLSPDEYDRRLESLKIAAEFGLTFASEWMPLEILGALAHQAGDTSEAVEYWEAAGNPVGQGGLDDPLVPPDELTRHANSRSNWDDLVSNISTPGDALRKIFEGKGLSPELAEHPGLPMSALSDVLSDDEEILLAAAANVSLSGEVFLQLADLEDEDPWRPFTELRVVLMSSPATPKEWLERPPLNEDWLNTVSGLEDEVFRHEDVQVKVAQMENPATDPRVLAEHINDINGEVRAAVARNPRCPSETLWKLSVDSDAQVRRAAAGNSRAPRELTGLVAGSSESHQSADDYTKLTSDVDIDDLFNKGLEQQELGNFDAAIDLYRAGAFAGDGICAFKLGYLYGESGDHVNSRWWYARGSAMGNIVCMNRLAWIALIDDEDANRARILCTQALSHPDDLTIDPKFGKGQSFYILGYLDYLDGEYDLARENLLKASSMKVEEAGALLQDLKEQGII